MKINLHYAVLALPLFLCSHLFSQESEDSVRQLYSRLQYLKDSYHSKQNTYEEAVGKRWAQKEEFTRQRERMQNEQSDMRQKIENAFTAVSTARDEVRREEQTLRTHRDSLKSAQETQKNIIRTVESIDSRYSENISADFPIHKDSLFAAHITLQESISPENSPRSYFTGLAALRIQRIMNSRTSSWERIDAVVEDDEVKNIRTLRLGHALAYGIQDNEAYYLNYYGRDRANPFSWQEVEDYENREMIAATLSGIESLEPGNTITLPVDVIQTSQSRDIISRESVSFQEKVSDFIRQGGFMMIPLGLIMLWALILILNRLVAYHIRHKRSDTFINKAISYLETGDLAGAQKLARKNKGVLAEILSNCLEHSERNRGSAEKAVKEILLTEMPILDKHLDTLAVIAASAPLMGLLGTVTGMIRMFTDITRFGTGDPQLLAGGISEALVTTETGLIIAIPVLLIHNFLRNRRNRIQADMEMYAMRILNRLWPAE
ncbi:MAG: MotA/TolQ/ExbB proton channel family protein [Fibrobacterota bacterium]